MHKSLIIIFLFCSPALFGQGFLNDTTFFDADYTNFQTGIEVDSGYFVTGSSARAVNFARLELMLGFIHRNGTKTLLLSDYDTLNNQRSIFWNNNLFFNDQGNFVVGYANCDTDRCYPRLKEISPSGQVLTDIDFEPLLQEMQSSTYDSGKIIQKKYDSTYVLIANVQDSTIQSAHSSGTLYIHMDKSFNVLDTQFFVSPNGSRLYTPFDVIELDSGKVIIMCNSVRISGWLGVNDEAVALFITVDKNGSVLSMDTYSDDIKLLFPHGLIRDVDNGFLFTYMKGFWTPNTWDYKNYACKVDSNFNMVWRTKITSREVYETVSLMNFEIKHTLDGNYITAGGHYYPTNNLQRSAALTKLNQSGEIVWQRYHYKYALPPNFSGQAPQYQIRDMLVRPDSGYTMLGGIIDYPELNAGNRGVYGYIVETNCLGFRGAPLAGASHTLDDNFVVVFHNTSTQASNFLWDFGDGATYTSGESEVYIPHAYPGEGPYIVQLIAEGCGAERDTISFDVFPETMEDTNVIVDVPGDFVIYPNPLGAMEELNFYMNPLNPEDGEVILEISSMYGEIVRRINLPAEGGDFSVRHQLAGGLYNVTVYQGNKIQQRRKLVVE